MGPLSTLESTQASFVDDLIGLIADSFGRRRALIFSLSLMVFSGIGEAFTRNFSLFCIFTFLRTMGIHGSFLIALLLNIELVQPQHRSLIAGNLVFASFELGKIIALMPFSLIKGLWYHITIHLIPIFTIIGASMMITESPRWLVAKDYMKLFKRGRGHRGQSGMEQSSLTQTRPRLFRLSFPRHGGTLLCLS